MKRVFTYSLILRFAALLILLESGFSVTQAAPEFRTVRQETNREITFSLVAPAQSVFRVERSTDLVVWTTVFTAAAVGTNQYTDTRGAFAGSGFYRAIGLETTNVLTGDHLVTGDGDVVIHPVKHGSLVLGWQDKLIYIDPIGGGSRFNGIGKADIILVTHDHGDHYDSATINAVRKTNSFLLVTSVVRAVLPAALRTNANTLTLTNRATASVLGVGIEAVPAYNLTQAFHPRGTGNGYVLTIGGKRIYITGDTDATDEMRALPEIDVAFVCMYPSFTMTPAAAAGAVRVFRPRVAYPYHYADPNSSSDSNSPKQQFKNAVGADLGIEVRLRKWY